jgi:ubiquinone/menaquinone biosynthesis C-methylase UbiE
MLFRNHNLKRIDRISSYFNGLIYPSEKILDVGSYNCLIAKELQDRYSVCIEGLDIKDYNITDIKNTIYDGLHFPYKDNSFDTVLILTTLHHCEDFIQVLKESRRVARQKVIVLEAAYDNKFELFLTMLRDIISNKRKGMNLPLHFQSKEQWRNLFNELDLKIIEERNYKSRILFILEKFINK